jgi:tetratricopeptide (TPR) repeat protein
MRRCASRSPSASSRSTGPRRRSVASRASPDLRPTAWRRAALCAQGEYERALPYLERAGPALALLRAQAFEALGRLEECATALDALLAASAAPSIDLLVLQGRRLARGGDPAGAAAAFRSALALDELDREALFGLGQALIAAGQRDEGLKVLAEHRRITPLCDQLDFALRAVDLAPNHGPNHAAVGDAERALGRFERAAAAYRAAEALASADELAPIALRHARLLAEDQHDVAAAVALLDGAFATARDARLAVRAGDLLLAQARPAEARARFEAALALRPGDAQIEQRVAAARAKEGQ